MEEVAEFSIDTEYKAEIFKAFVGYYRLYGAIEGYNRFVWDNPSNLVEEVGFDVLWVLLFGDWDGSYLKTKRIYNRRRRLLKLEDWEILLDRYNHRCFYCGKRDKKLTKDHVVPISYGGEDVIDNVVPACWPCNYKKRARDIAEFKNGATLKLL